MATEIKLRRGTTSQHASFNGAEGEVTFDTDLHTLIVHNNAGNGTGERLAKYSELGSALTVEDAGSDTTMFPLLSTDATGAINPKTDTSAYTYNAATGALSATTFIGAFTGNVTGNVSGTALTVTQAAQTAITSVGTLTGLSVNTSNAEASINVGTDFLKITCSDADSGVLIENASGYANQPDLILRRTTASSNISNGEGIGNILFDAKNANEDNENYSAIVARVDDKTTGSEDGSLDFNIKVDGSFVKRIELDSVGSTFIGDVVVDTGSVKLKDASDNVTTISENAGGNITLTLPSATGTIALTSDITVTASSTTTLTNKSISGEQINSGTVAAARVATLNQDTTGHAASADIATGALVSYGSSGNIAHDTVKTWAGKTVIYTAGSGNLVIGVPELADLSAGKQIHFVNASGGEIQFDLDQSGADPAPTIDICTGAAVVNTGTDNPKIVAGGVATLVSLTTNKLVMFGSGVVDT